MMKFYIAVLLLLIKTSFTFGQKETFFKNVAPIIYNKCAPCHRPGEAAPFNLISYEDVVKRASFIKDVINTGYMPPWRADSHYTSSSFSNVRMLTAAEKKTINNWIDSKMPKGHEIKSTTDILNKYHEGTRYSRQPDAVLSVSKPFQVKGDNAERFIVFKIPFEFDKAQNVEAIEFISKNKKVIHHANFAIYDVPDAISTTSQPDFINNTVGESDESQIAYAPLKTNMVYYGGWIPGTGYESYPKDIGWTMPKRGVILLTIHYAPVGKDEIDLSGVNFFFTTTPIKRVIDVINFGSGGVAEEEITPYFMIPADSVRKFTLVVSNPEKQSIIAVWPHMHLLGKSFKAYAITPQKDTLKLISIPDWDFNWQELYTYKKPIIVPEGSRLIVEAVYDNTKNNPKNPSNPPKMVFGGGEMKTKDEMMTMLLLYLPYKEDDENLNLEDQK
ncbi:cytochrome c [Pedobacter ginsengisoli]|nr:cytochrome c [Pedobacter ginsengisoli]